MRLLIDGTCIFWYTIHMV